MQQVDDEMTVWAAGHSSQNITAGEKSRTGLRSLRLLKDFIPIGSFLR